MGKRGSKGQGGPTRVVGYARVSTEGQAVSGAGMDAQRAAIMAEVERRGWQLVELIEDAGVSAKTLTRPGIERALGMVDGGEADVLLVAKLDRLSRSLLDFASLMDRSRKRGWQVVCLDLGIDTSSASGEMMATVLASFAAYERRLIGERTRVALAAKKAQGVKIGRRSTVPEDVRVRVRAAREQGQTYRAIADALNDDGVPTGQGGARWYASGVRAVELADA